MTTELRPGTRLRSVACTTEVVVVRAPGELVEIRCGGRALVGIGEPVAGDIELDPGFAAGTMLGKRYADEGSTLELLCTKAGAGSLSIGDVPMQLSGAKPLPASD